MKRSFFFVAALLLVLAAFEGGARIAERSVPVPLRWYDASTEAKIDQMAKLDSADRVIVGSSMAWQAFDPTGLINDEFPVAYNAGLNGGVPPVMQRWVLDEVVPRLEPSQVIWGLSSLDFAPNYGDQNVDRYVEALNARTGALANIEQWASGWSSLVRMRPALRDPGQLVGAEANELDRDRAEALRFLGPQGQRLDFTVRGASELEAIQRARLRNFVIDETDRLIVLETVRSLQAQGIEVVLVELPVPNRFIALHPNGPDDHAAVGAAIDAIAQETDSRFIDLSEGFRNRQFVDYTHLDQPSIEVATARLAEALDGGSDDRGADHSVVDWQPDVESGDGVTTYGACRIEIVEDEYGAETEIERCDDDTSEALPPFDEADASRAFMDLVEVGLTARDECSPALSSRVDDWYATSPYRAQRDVAELEPTVRALGQLHDELCEGTVDGFDDRAFEIAEVLLDHLETDARPSESLQALAAAVSRWTELTEAERLTVLLSLHNHLELQLTSLTRPSYWGRSDQLVHLASFTNSDAESVTAIVGNSTALRVRASELTTSVLDGAVFNMAVSGMPPDLVVPWVDVVDHDGRIDQWIYYLPVHDVFRGASADGSCVFDPDGPAARGRTNYEHQAGAFDLVRDAVWSWFAPETALATDPLRHNALRRYSDLEYGGSFVSRPAGEANRIAEFAASVADRPYCAERLTQHVSAVEALVAAGDVVTVVLQPNPIEVMGVLAVTPEQIVRRFERRLDGIATVIAPIDQFDDPSYWEDGVHLSDVGGELMTEILAEALAS